MLLLLMLPLVVQTQCCCWCPAIVVDVTMVADEMKVTPLKFSWYQVRPSSATRLQPPTELITWRFIWPFIRVPHPILPADASSSQQSLSTTKSRWAISINFCFFPSSRFNCNMLNHRHLMDDHSRLSLFNVLLQINNCHVYILASTWNFEAKYNFRSWI